MVTEATGVTDAGAARACGAASAASIPAPTTAPAIRELAFRIFVPLRMNLRGLFHPIAFQAMPILRLGEKFRQGQSKKLSDT
ncbi:hypothetical protein [Streptomyces sp. CBMA123]|uniref:hypothetical protein n=1 Tax=Streptomyces sp. CBMA123 TaxID=1896313 RepID=UPI001661AF11|nr:hypothetical protein [Streptomyces sp. CBMA123]